MHDWDRKRQIAEHIPAIERRRLLLGFMDEEDAVHELQSSRTVGSPVDPLDSSTRKSSEDTPDEEDCVDLWKRANANVDSVNHPEYESSAVDLKDLPDDEEVQEYVDAFVNDPLTQAGLEDEPADSWSIKLVPLEHLVAFQTDVTKTAYQDEVPTESDDIVDLLQYALPVDNGPLVEDQMIEDEFFSGWQFVSRSPNFYVSGPYQTRYEADDSVFATVEFDLEWNPNFLYVEHIRDRYVLKNGYHRAYQLLQAGETHVPAVVLEAQTYDDSGESGSGFFDPELVMGDRPPMLLDFDSSIAVDIERRAKNHVVRIIAETTDILR